MGQHWERAWTLLLWLMKSMTQHSAYHLTLCDRTTSYSRLNSAAAMAPFRTCRHVHHCYNYLPNREEEGFQTSPNCKAGTVHQEIRQQPVHGASIT